MPSEKVLNEKKQIVEELTGKLKSQAGVFVDYSGISVNEDTVMRRKLRQENIDYQVIKNTLMRFAIKNVGFEELDPILNGTTSLAISKDDSIAPARVIKEFADQFEGFFEIKAGFMDGKVLSADEVVKLAGIPPLPVLQSRLLGTMLAPIATLAVVLKAIAERGGASADTGAEAIATEEPEAPAEAEAVAAKEPEAPAEAEATAVEAPEAPAEAETPAAKEPEAPAEPAKKSSSKAAPKEAKPKEAKPKEAKPKEAKAKEAAPDDSTAPESPAEESGKADDPA